MKKSKVKYLSVVLVTLVALLALYGCGGSGQNAAPAEKDEPAPSGQEAAQTAEPQDLVIKEYGYTIDDGYLQYAVAIENPNTAFEPDYAVISIVGTDKGGDVVFSDDWTISHLPCGSTTYWTQSVGSGKASKDLNVDITVSVDSDGWESSSDQDTDVYEISEPKFQKDGFSPSVTGTISLAKEAPDDDFLKPMLVAIFRDADGKIMTGDSTFVDTELKVGKKTAFEISTYNAPKAFKTVEVYANPW